MRPGARPLPPPSTHAPFVETPRDTAKEYALHSFAPLQVRCSTDISPSFLPPSHIPWHPFLLLRLIRLSFLPFLPQPRV